MEVTILRRDLLSQKGEKHGRILWCLFATFLLFPGTSCHTALRASIGALIISAQSSSTPPAPFSHSPPSLSFPPSLTLPSTNRFSFLEIRGCIHGNKARAGGGDCREGWRGGETVGRGEGVSSLACYSTTGKECERVILACWSPAIYTRLLEMQENHQWLMRSKLFNCTKGIFPPLKIRNLLILAFARLDLRTYNKFALKKKKTEASLLVCLVFRVC